MTGVQSSLKVGPKLLTKHLGSTWTDLMCTRLTSKKKSTVQTSQKTLRHFNAYEMNQTGRLWRQKSKGLQDLIRLSLV